MTTDRPEELGFTAMIDGDHDRVRTFARMHADGAVSDRERAVRLYYAVRDGIRYDPYRIDLSVDGMRASRCLAVGHGWCVPKAVLLAACCRSLNIPAGLGFADVRNHLTTPRLRRVMETDVFFWHGYTRIHIAGRWVKATPAFNIELCHRSRLKPLDFDGSADALFHPFDLTGKTHMEYIRHRGDYWDVPLDRIRETFARHYAPLKALNEGRFDEEVEGEAAADSRK